MTPVCHVERVSGRRSVMRHLRMPVRVERRRSVTVDMLSRSLLLLLMMLLLTSNRLIPLSFPILMFPSTIPLPISFSLTMTSKPFPLSFPLPLLVSFMFTEIPLHLTLPLLFLFTCIRFRPVIIPLSIGRTASSSRTSDATSHHRRPARRWSTLSFGVDASGRLMISAMRVRLDVRHGRRVN
jgi:hypothetical protein